MLPFFIRSGVLESPSLLLSYHTSILPNTQHYCTNNNPDIYHLSTPKSSTPDLHINTGTHEDGFDRDIEEWEYYYSDGDSDDDSDMDDVTAAGTFFEKVD